MRRANPRWGARRIAFEVARTGTGTAPSRATVHRVLARNGLIRRQEQKHRRKYKRWQRETPMHLWQMDLVGGIFLADGRECKMLAGIDDHSRFVVIATVLAVPSGRAVADGFVQERWHQTLRRELLDVSGPFNDLPAAQAAVDAWVHTYNTARPHQALDMATPASRFRPNPPPEPTVVAAPATAAEPSTVAEPAAPVAMLIPASAPAVEFEAVVAATGIVGVLPRVQRVRLGTSYAGRRSRVWADEHTVHIVIDGELVRSATSRLDAGNLHELSMRGAVWA